MLITLKLNNKSLPVTAPLGAAGYAVIQDGATARVIFAMILKGETGLDALNRVYGEQTVLKWIPVAARPEEQTSSIFGPNPYVEYSFLMNNGSWQPATEALANFLRVLQGAQYLPVAPPSELGATIATFSRRKGK